MVKRAETLSRSGLEPTVDAALAAPGRRSAWPEPLRAAWDAHRAACVREELEFQLKLGSVVALVALLIDLAAVPAMAGVSLLVRLLTVVPLNIAGVIALRRGRVGTAKVFASLGVSTFAGSAIWFSSYGSSDVIARVSTATIVLLVLSLYTLPFSLQEKIRYGLLFSIVTFLAGLWPHPVPPGLLLQHMVLCLVAGGGALVMVRRMWQLESRDFLRSLKEGFVRQELERNNDLLRELSERDPLTGLSNRRSFARIFDAFRGVRTHGAVALMMIDLDHFKQFNDRYGHQAGDDCLIQVARELERCVGGHGGHVARFGGEEFVALVPETGGTDGEAVAHLLHRRLSAIPLAVGADEPARITASIGMARSHPGHDLDTLIALADEALYRAKNNGRDRAEMATSAAPVLRRVL